MTERERSMPNPTGESVREPRVKRWQAEFPYHWDADDLVSRRQFLNFTVYTSGALFAVTTFLAMLGLIRRPAPTEERLIARASEIAEGEVVYFHYPGPEDEAMLLHLPGDRFVAYSQTCTHLACSVYYQPQHDRLLCPCHEGIFNPVSGDPTAGPPQCRLPRITLRQEGDLLYAVARVP
jgi:Rieske Fe-S protein